MTTAMRNANERMPSLTACVLPWLAALTAALGYFILFAPGHYSFDAAYLWWMSRHDSFEAGHPVALGMLWQAVRAVLPDPHGFFALQLALVGAGLGLIASALPVRPIVQATVVLVIAAWPAFGALLPQVWKDVWMVGALLVAVGSLLHDYRSPNRALRILAFLMLAFATTLRLNAISGVLPLLVWLLAAEARSLRFGHSQQRVRVVVAAWLFVFVVLVSLPTLRPDIRPSPPWVSTALWDLAAVEITTERQQIPALYRQQGVSVADLSAAFRPDTNVSIFAAPLIRYHAGSIPDEATESILKRAWLTLPFREPRAYAAHRFRLARHLLGVGVVRDHGLALMPGVVPLLDNPTIGASTQPLAIWLQDFWRRSHPTAMFEGCWYLIASALVLLLALQWRCWPAAFVAGSGLCSALPLIVVSPSADFRYLLWLVASALVGMLLLLPTRR